MKKNLIFICLSLLFIGFTAFEETSNDCFSLKASYYHDMFNGRKTANGEIFHNNKIMAASNLFPLNTLVKVSNVNNNKSVIVKITDRINDRFTHKRIDLSKTAFKQIGNTRSGIISVTVEKYKD